LIIFEKILEFVKKVYLIIFEKILEKNNKVSSRSANGTAAMNPLKLCI